MKQKIGRKLLGFLLSLALVLGLMFGMSLTAYAEEEVTTSAQLKSKLEAGTDVKLGADIIHDSQIKIRTTVELDLNGHTLSYSGEPEVCLSVIENGNLTISDSTNGEGKYEIGNHVITNRAGTLTIKGGEISGRNSAVGTIQNLATMTVSGGKIFGKSSYGGAIYNSGTLNISDGTVSGYSSNTYGAIFNAANGILEVNGGTISGSDSGVGGSGIFNAGKVTISGGTIEGAGTGTYCGGIKCFRGTVTVNGGTIKGNRASLNYYYDPTLTITDGSFEGELILQSTGERKIAGGVFSVKPNEGAYELEDGKSWVALTDSTYQYGVTDTPTVSVTPATTSKEYDASGVKLTAELLPAVVSAKTATETENFTIDYAYQWAKDGTAIDGKTENTYTTGGNVTDSGTYKCTATTANVGYEGSATVTIKSAASGRSATPADALVYSGVEQALVKEGSVEGGTLMYAVTTEPTQPALDAYSEAIPTASEAGTYYVWYYVKGDKNHNDTEPAMLTVVIAPQPAADEPETPAEPSYLILAKLSTSGKKALKVTWTKVPGAEGFDIYLAHCGQTLQQVGSVGGSATSYTVKGLKKYDAYKGFVRAWKTVNGAKVTIGESPLVHAITGGKTNKYVNPKKVTVKKSKVKLAVGKTSKIKASVTKAAKNRKLMNHESKLRYYSNNPAVATVSASGKITAVGTGSCKIYVVAINGARAAVKVTVK